MNISLRLTAWFVIIGVIVALAAFAFAIFTRVSKRPRRLGGLLAVLPNLLMLVLVYSLAVHMRLRLEEWPLPVQQWKAPALLIAHAQLARRYWAIQLLLSGTLLPVALLTCTLVRRWRGAVAYLGIYVIGYVISFGLFLLAPSGFLNWWWD